VVIVSFAVRDLLRACLRTTYASLAASPELESVVWVVDNASGDGSVEMVASEFPQAKLIARPDNLGFAGGNNLALANLGFGAAPGGSGATQVGAERPDLVLLLNPDAEPVGDGIGRMAHFLLEHPKAGGAGAQLQYPDGRFQHGAFAFPGLLQLWFDLFPPRPARLLESRLNGRYPRSLYDVGTPFPVDFGLGAALMVRREAIEAAGLLDEGYFMYAEEVDWCWRIQRAGWRFYCVPAARVIHHGGASARQFRSQSVLNLWRSRRRLYTRFYGPVRRFLAGQIVRLGMTAEARRARHAYAAGQIDAAEKHARVETAEAVRRLFVRWETG
jgi:N-acetylglucosaminyl-diphospho-decaprenol L-rhamnosyltransferase